MSDKKTISELFVEDPWVQDFMSSIYETYGLPVSSESCLCKTDKILFVWGMMNLVQGMKRLDSWEKARSENQDYETAAYNFIKEFHETTGGHIIPSEKETGEKNEI